MALFLFRLYNNTSGDGIMKCKFCGTEYHGSYCPNCGSNNPNYAEPEVQVEEKPVKEPEVEIKTKEETERDRKPRKSRVAMGLLAFFFGAIGIQHFYIGRTARGIFSILFCWTGIPALIGIIEAMIILFEDKSEFEFRYKVKAID